ncbi:uncharacterized protein TNCV_1919141 [Trichonephila clavipes]|nr:uncharacterized protein TNCV_1919141 [Trichonephila clavipes]
MSSVGYSSSPELWSRWSSPILAWPQSGLTSSAARPTHWRYTPKKSCPVVRRKQATASDLSKCLEIRPTVVSFPWLSKSLCFLDHDSIFVNECGNNDIYSSESQGDIRLRRLELDIKDEKNK